MRIRAFTNSILDFFNLKLGVIALLVGALSIADNKGFLYTVDGFFLDVSYAIHNYHTPIQHTDIENIPKEANLVVLSISEEMYKNDFSRHSPLDREVLSTVIDKIARQNPQSINIDLEMAPFEKSNSANQILLDTLVKASKDTPINIVLTSIGLTQENRTSRYEWLDKLCNNGINIHFPTLILSKGLLSDNQSVSRYYPELPSLGLDSKGSDIDPCSKRRLNHFKFMPVKHIIGSEVLLGKPHIYELDKEKINFTKPESVAIVTLDSANSLDKLPDLHKKDVFLGSGYVANKDGRVDEYLTPIGLLPGVAIHAFNKYTEKHPIEAVSGLIELAVDLVLSIVISILIIKTRGVNFYLAVIVGSTIFISLFFLFPVFLRHGLWVPPFIAIIGGISAIFESFIDTDGELQEDGGNMLYKLLSIFSYAVLFAALLTEFDPGEERVQAAIVLFVLTVLAAWKSQNFNFDTTKAMIVKISLSALIAYFSLQYLSW